MNGLSATGGGAPAGIRLQVAGSVAAGRLRSNLRSAELAGRKTELRGCILLTPLAFLIAGTLVIVDQLFKLIAVNIIKPAGQITAVKNLLSFVYVENRGAALGILQDKRWVFITATVVIMAVFIWFMTCYDIKSKTLYISSVLVIAGGIGNLIDRMVLGYVVDFISVSFFPPVFNFADCCVTIGAVLLLASVFFKDTAVKKKRVD